MTSSINELKLVNKLGNLYWYLNEYLKDIFIKLWGLNYIFFSKLLHEKMIPQILKMPMAEYGSR